MWWGKKDEVMELYYVGVEEVMEWWENGRGEGVVR